MKREDRRIERGCVAALAAVLTLPEMPRLYAGASSAEANTNAPEQAAQVTSAAATSTQVRPGKHGRLHGRGGPFALQSYEAYLARINTTGGIHAWGTPIELLLARRPDSEPRVFLTICSRPDQDALLQKYADLSDVVTIMPLALVCTDTPSPAEPLWPAYAHPLINRIRTIRHVTEGKILYAHIDSTGGNHGWLPGEVVRPTIEQVEWSVFAVIGACYDGIVWNGMHFPKWSDRLSRLAAALAPFADELTKAQPVPWVREPGGRPCTAMAAEHHLFIVLLNADCAQLNVENMCFALAAPSPQTGAVVIDPPRSITLQSCRYYDGSPASIDAVEGKQTVDYRFRGGGTMLVVDLRPKGSKAKGDDSR